MTTLQFRAAALALVALPTLLFAGCSPECVDQADCAAKAEAAQSEFTCVSGKCVMGSPFNDGGTEDDAGSGGGGGTEDDAGTGGGGGATGGGGGTTDAGDTDAGSGDAGAGDDAGTGDAGLDVDAGVVEASPEGSYTASLSGAQAGSASGETGTGTFTVLASGDGGYTFTWSITHSGGSGGSTTGGIRTGLAGFPGTAWITFAGAGSPINGMQAITPAQANDVRDGRAFVNLVRSNLAFRGQIIPAGHQLWTARLATPVPGATFGGTQFIVPLDGGAISYLGAWTSDVAAEMAHIHQGGAAGSGGVIVPLSLTADAGGLQGSFDPATLTAGDTDGGLYVNVHTTDAGAGLIRGQLVKH